MHHKLILIDHSQLGQRQRELHAQKMTFLIPGFLASEFNQDTHAWGGGMEVCARRVAPGLSTAGRAGAASCTLAVSAIDQVIAHLEGLGIDISERPSGAR